MVKHMGAGIIRYKKNNAGKVVFDSVNMLFMILLVIITVLPFLYVLVFSFQSPEDYRTRGLAFPREFSLNNYILLLSRGSKVLQSFQVTVVITVAGALISIILTTMLAYGISKKYLPGRTFFVTFIFITMIVGGGLIPTYFMVRATGLTNTLWSVMIPNAVAAFYVFIMRNFFAAIPPELEESARMDGANDIRILFRIIIPVSMPVIATIGLFYAVERWNTFFNAYIYITNTKLHPLQVVLNSIINSHNPAVDPAMAAQKAMMMPSADILRMSAIMVTILPIMLVYPFLQRFFVKGIMIGSIKG